MPYLPDLATMLTPGARIPGDGVEYVLEEHPLGPVTLPTGRVVACDPLTDAEDAPPFLVEVPPGRYALHAWVVALHRGGAEADRRTAALQLVIAGDPAARWEPALTADQDAVRLGPDAYFGFPVDAGVATLADEAAVRALAAWDDDRLEDVYIPARFPPAPTAIDAVTDEPTRANVITVSSGWGDGVYPTFVGYTTDGRVASFVTDFMLIPELATG